MPLSPPSAIVADEAYAAHLPEVGKCIRLLLLTDTSVLTAGGSERFLRNLITGLSPDRYRITVVQLMDSVAMRVESQSLFNGDHIQVMKLPLGAIYGARGWRALRELRSMVRRGRFHIIQSQHEKSDLLNAALPRSPGTVHISNRRDMGFNKSSRLRLAFRLLNHRFHYVIAPSQSILSGLAQQEALDLRRMLWIPNGVDTQQFSPPSRHRRDTERHELHLSEDDIVFACVASLTPVKCHQKLLHAFAQAYRLEPRLRLLQVGDGPLRTEISELITALGLDDAVHLLGDRSDVDQVLRASDALILTSSTEGMSNAILEAMASGLPVIATSVGGNPHLVEHGTTGFLVAPDDIDGIADAIGTLADSPETRLIMGQAGRSRAEQVLSLENMIHAYDRLYERLIGR